MGGGESEGQTGEDGERKSRGGADYACKSGSSFSNVISFFGWWYLADSKVLVSAARVALFDEVRAAIPFVKTRRVTEAAFCLARQAISFTAPLLDYGFGKTLCGEIVAAIPLVQTRDVAMTRVHIVAPCPILRVRIPALVFAGRRSIGERHSNLFLGDRCGVVASLWRF